MSVAGVFVNLSRVLFADVVRLNPVTALGGLLEVVGLQNVQPGKTTTVWQTNLAARAAMNEALVMARSWLVNVDSNRPEQGWADSQ